MLYIWCAPSMPCPNKRWDKTQLFVTVSKPLGTFLSQTMILILLSLIVINHTESSRMNHFGSLVVRTCTARGDFYYARSTYSYSMSRSRSISASHLIKQKVWLQLVGVVTSWRRLDVPVEHWYPSKWARRRGEASCKINIWKASCVASSQEVSRQLLSKLFLFHHQAKQGSRNLSWSMTKTSKLQMTTSTTG